MATTNNAPKIERNIINAHIINDKMSGSYQLTLNDNIQRYVKTHPEEQDEEKQFTLENVDNISFFTGDVIKAIIDSNKLFKVIYTKANFNLANARKTENTASIDKFKQLKLDAQAFALSDATITLTYKDVPKGTPEEYVDTDGQKKTRNSKRNKRIYEIKSITLGSFAEELLRDLLRS